MKSRKQCTQKVMYTNGKEFSAIVKYYGSKVGIITISDAETEIFVDSELDKLYNDDCNIIVASARSRSSAGGVYEILWQFGKDNGIATMETSTYHPYEEYHDSLSHENINQMCALAHLGATDYFISFNL